MTTWYMNSAPGVDVFPLSAGSSGNPTATCTITGVNAPAGSTVVVWVMEGGGAAAPGTLADGANTYTLGLQQTLPAGIGMVFYAQTAAALSNATLTYTKRSASHSCSMTAMAVVPSVGITLALDLLFGATTVGTGVFPLVTSAPPSRRQTVALGGVFYSGPSAGITFALPAGPVWAMPPYPRNSYPDAQVGVGWVVSGSTKPVAFAPTLGAAATNWTAMILGFSITPEPTEGWYGIQPHQPGTPYAPGALVRQNSIPGFGNHRVFWSSGGTSGSSEPAWNLGRGATTLDGGVVWTEVTGQAADRPFADLLAAAPRIAGGDRLFADDNHAEVWGPNATNSRYTPTFPTAVPVPEIYLGNSWTHILPSAIASTTVNNCNFHGAGYFEGGNIRISQGAFPYSISNNYEGMEKFKGTKFYISNLLTFGWDNNGPAYADDCTFVGEPYIGNSSVAAIQLSHGAKIRRAKFSGRWNSTYLFAAYQTAQPNGTASDSDLSNIFGDTGSLVQLDRNNNSMGNSGYRFERCSLPPGLAIGQNKFGIENMIDVVECGGASPVRRLERWTGQGSHVRDIVVVRHGGAVSSCVPVSWRFLTTPFISWPLPFYSMELPAKKLTPVGSIVYATVYGIVDPSSPLLQSNAQLWAEFVLLDPDGGFGQVVSTGINNALDPSSPLQVDPASVWSGGGFAFKMTVAVSGITRPQIATATIKCSVPNATFWIDPRLY